MLQRYDISMDVEANRLSIEEFHVLGRISRKRGNLETANKKFSFIHKVTYNGDIIRAAINEGKGALISALRSDNFFPIRSCVEIIVERVIELFEDNSDSFSEVIFDDQALFSKDDE
ncbi:MAG: hypothetical protein JRF22_04015 [Deltaproteobacteria bacterium]|jgi:hypothetical protein|nr:hypothetical protein [Deltaproteobacteria bacterium]